MDIMLIYPPIGVEERYARKVGKKIGGDLPPLGIACLAAFVREHGFEADVVDSISRRGLFLFDVWGYVPGSGPGDYWKQYTPSREALDLLENKLGDHWLGMDVGEQVRQGRRMSETIG